MKHANRKIIFFLLFWLLIFGFLGANYARAGLWNMQQGLNSGDIGQAFDQGGDPKDLRVVIGQLIRVILGFTGFIFMVLILVAGFKWMTSQGNETTITEAKGHLRAAVIGLVLIMLSYAIASFITRCFYSVSTESGFWVCVF